MFQSRRWFSIFLGILIFYCPGAHADYQALVAGIEGISVFRYDGNTWAKVQTVPCSSLIPFDVAIAPNGYTALVTFGAGTNSIGVLTYNGVYWSEPEFIDVVGRDSYGVAIASDGSFAIVAHKDGTASSLTYNGTSWSLGSTFAVGDDSTELAISSDNTTTFLTNQTADTVSVLTNGFPWNYTTVSGFGGPLGVATYGSVALVTNNSSTDISVLEYTGTWNIVDTLTVGVTPWGIAITPNESMALVAIHGSGTVRVLQQTGTTSSWSAIDTVTVGSSPEGVAIAQNGTTALVCNQGSDSVSALSYNGSVWGVSQTLEGVALPTEVSIGFDPYHGAVTSRVSCNRASDQKDNYVSLSWNAQTTSASSYSIYRDGVWIASVPGNQSSYENHYLSSHTTYTYQVFANLSGGSSALLDTITITTQ